jgi:hypothetical protein
MGTEPLIGFFCKQGVFKRGVFETYPAGPGTWYIDNAPLPAGTYECWAEIDWFDADGNAVHEESNHIYGVGTP